MSFDNVRISHKDTLSTLFLVPKTNFPALKYLSLCQMQIVDDNIEWMSQGLKGMDQIKCLSLSGNNLTFEGALSLSQGIILTSKLEKLNLDNNFLGSRGTKLICEALCGNPRVKSLNLSGNGIDDTSAASIGKLLFETKLKELYLSSNLLSAEGLSLIFDVI